MKKTFKQSKQSNRGYALLITIIFIGIALLLLGSMMDWTNSSAKQTERNNLFSMSTAAAEAATERVIAQMSRDFFNQSLQPAIYYTPYYPTPADQANWPVKFSFSDGAGNANLTGVITIPVVWTTNWTRINAVNSAYSNLWAAVQNCTITSTATPINQPYSVPATVRQQFQLCSIPIFQFAIFYNMNMEICPGVAIVVNGKTHVNGQIWADPGVSLTFNDTVETTASNIIYSRNTNDDSQSVTANPKVIYLKPDGSTNSPSLAVDAVTMPLGTNLASPSDILALPPTGVDANSAVGQEYLYNLADIIVSNSASGSVTAYYQNSNNTPRLASLPYDVSISTTNFINSYTTNITYTITTNWNYNHTKINSYTTNTIKTYTTNTTSSVTTTNFYSFVTNTTFYDYREGKTVQAVELNVGALTNWLYGTNGSTDNTLTYNDTGHYIDSVYVYNNAPSDNSHLPAVRVANGSVLPSTNGLTVATPQPIYVLGNYNASGSSLNNGTNVANAAPAAFIGDALTVLSTSWKDTYTSGTGLGSRPAGNTTINAATFEGIVVSTNISGTKYYSGGVENFLRLLEDWSGSGQKTLTYNGSIVVMFNSLYATNYWKTPGNYYNVPTRAWGFDVNFSLGQGNLPPISPQVKTLVPTGWSVY